tara:strand:- start:592 stop:780 length:189 start_codon:yes stop_codon:yes gene_type:complete
MILRDDIKQLIIEKIEYLSKEIRKIETASKELSLKAEENSLHIAYRAQKKIMQELLDDIVRR